MDIDWDKAPPWARYVVQHGEVVEFCAEWCDGKIPEGWLVLAKRPKPPLTKEQIEAVREYDEWLGQFINESGVGADRWLKQRGGEHE